FATAGDQVEQLAGVGALHVHVGVYGSDWVHTLRLHIAVYEFGAAVHLEGVERVVALHTGLEHGLGLVATAASHRSVNHFYTGIKLLIEIEDVVLAFGLATGGPPAKELELAFGAGVGLDALCGERSHLVRCSHRGGWGHHG